MRREDYESLDALEATLWWFAGMREITAAIIDPVSPARVDRSILDAGCGTGGNLRWLQAYAGDGKVMGVDLVTDALHFCNKHGLQNLAQASVTNLPFADASFDLVTSFDVLVQLHRQNSDAVALSEIYRVLRPGGHAFVRVAAYEWMRSSHDEALGTQRRTAFLHCRENCSKQDFESDGPVLIVVLKQITERERALGEFVEIAGN